MVNNNDNMTPNPFSKVHHGDNVVFYRELKKIQQKELAITLGWSQSVLSNLEKMPVIDDEKLKQIANALGVTLEELKYTNARESATYYIFNKEVSNVGDVSEQNNYNYVEKVSELYEIIANLKVENALLKQEKELSKNK